MPDDPKNPYQGPAGGWGALAASAEIITREKAIARGSAALLRVNQKDGFDCPGCAWPDPHDHRSAFEFCENGVKAVVWESTSKRVDAAFFAKHTVCELRKKSDHWLESQGRLVNPLAYDPKTDHFAPIPWSEAFETIGATLRSLDDPNQAAFYTSGRASNEAAYLYQLFVRMFGTNNLPDCSNLCHESSGVGLTQTIGIGKGTVSLADFDEADAIFVIGQNPGTNHPRMLSALQGAARRGAQIVAINPLVERGLEKFLHPQEAGAMLCNKATPIATAYLQPTIGGDLALLTGICKHILAAEDAAPGTILDHAFIDEHTTSFAEFAESVRAADWETIETQSGLRSSQIQEVADIYLQAKSVICCWAMGLTQHTHGVATIQFVVNLLLMRGNIGRPGAGACPVRGHSNVQGNRTVGINHHLPPAFGEKMEKLYDFKAPTTHGYDVVEAIKAMNDGRVRVFMALGGNLVPASPDTELTAAALEKTELAIHVATKLNRTHLVHGKQALILPCLGRTEIDQQVAGPQVVTVEDSMGDVHASEGRNAPAGEQLLSETAIVANIAAATLPPGKPDWRGFVADYATIRDHIEKVLPIFKDYNARIAEPGGFSLKNTARDREWITGTGKANFTVAAIPDLTLPPGRLRLMTIRSHDQYNTTIYGNDDRYRGIKGQRTVILLNVADIANREMAASDAVTITSFGPDGRGRQVTGFTIVPYDIPEGCAAAYFPEANPLVAIDSVAAGSNTPVSKLIEIEISRG